MRILPLIAAALALGGCGYDTYGRGGVSAGYGYAGNFYGGGYNDFYGQNLGYGYGSGWYNSFFYPGSGFYVYDRGGRRTRWNGDQQRYFGELRNDRQAFRGERRDDRQALRAGTVTREQFRQDRRTDRQGFRQDRQQDRRAFRAQEGRNPGIARQRDIRPPRANGGGQRGMGQRSMGQRARNPQQ